MSHGKREFELLLVEDNEDDAFLVQHALRRAHPGRYTFTPATTLAEAREILARRAFDAILLDLSLPDSVGLATLEALADHASLSPVVIVTGLMDEDVATDAVRHGAQDYLVKGQMDGRAMARAIHYAMDHKAAKVALQAAYEELEQKVQERTADLAASVAALEGEMKRRVEAEDATQKINRTLRVLTTANEVLARGGDEEQLFAEICRVLVEVGGYRMAWVGFAVDDEARSVRPVASRGFDSGYLDQAAITWGDGAMGQGPTGSAIRTRRLKVGNDFVTDPELAPWRELALERGFRSSIALPLLMRGGQVVGALTIYQPEPGAFSSDEVTLLNQLAQDLAFGIEDLCTRRALWESQERLLQVVRSAPVGLWAVDCRGTCTLAEGRLPSPGLEAGEAVGRPLRDLLPATSSIRRSIPKSVQQAMRGREVTSEIEHDGRIYDARYSPVRSPSGEITGVMCVSTDITERRRMEREVLSALEREQRRIGRDLHDTVQGNLAGMVLKLGALGQIMARQHDESARSLVADIQRVGEIAQQTVKQTRGLARGLCPTNLADEGLAAALEQLTETVNDLFRVACDFQARGSVSIRDEAVATQLYYICQEALYNAVKHSKASAISVRLHGHKKTVTCSVRDQGIGLPVDTTACKGMGLRAMHYRAQLIGASLEIRRAPQGGTEVICSLVTPVRPRSV